MKETTERLAVRAAGDGGNCNAATGSSEPALRHSTNQVGGQTHGND
jgi:hypothetical protein